MITPRAAPALVLIVDDEIAFRDVLAHVLRDEGYRVEVASNGVEALAHLRRERPALMLLDLVMPVMSGTDVLASMSSDPDLAPVPVLVVSGAPERVKVVAGKVAGVATKPVNLEALLQSVSSLVS